MASLHLPLNKKANGKKVNCKLPKNTDDKMSTPSNNVQNSKRCSDNIVQEGQGSGTGFCVQSPECFLDLDQSQWSAGECNTSQWTTTSGCDSRFVIPEQTDHLPAESDEIKEDAARAWNTTYTAGIEETKESKFNVDGSSWSTTVDNQRYKDIGTSAYHVTGHNEHNGDLPIHYTPDKSNGRYLSHWQCQILRNAFLQTDGYIDEKTLNNLETQLGAHRSHINMWFAARRVHIQRWLRKDPSEIRDHLDSIFFDFLTLNDAFHSQDEQRAHITVPQGAAPYFTTSTTLLQGGTTLGDPFTSETTARITAWRQQNKKQNYLIRSSAAVRAKHSSSNFAGEVRGQQKNISHRLGTTQNVSQSQGNVTLVKHRKISWGVYPPAHKVVDPSMTVQETARTPARTSSKTPFAKASANRAHKASRNSKDKSTTLADISKILLRPKGGAVIENKSSGNTGTSHTASNRATRATVSIDKPSSPTGFSKALMSPNEGRDSLKKKANDTSDYVAAIMNYRVYPPAPRNASDFAQWSLSEN